MKFINANKLHRKSGVSGTRPLRGVKGPSLYLTSNEALAGSVLQIGRQLFHRGFDTDAVLGAQLVDFAVFDKTVGPADASKKG